MVQNRYLYVQHLVFFTDGFEKFWRIPWERYIDSRDHYEPDLPPPAFYEREYFTVADMSKFIALIIDSMNHDVSISSVLSPTDRLHALLEDTEKISREKFIGFSHNQIYVHFYRPPVNSWRFYFSWLEIRLWTFERQKKE